MKKHVFIIPCIIAIIAIGLLIGLPDDRNLEPDSDDEIPKVITSFAPVQSDTDTKSAVVSDEPTTVVSDTDTKSAVVSDEPTTEEVPDTGEITNNTNTSEDQERYNWLSEDMPIPEQKDGDPFSVELAKQKAIEEGTYISNPETMDPEQLHSAIYNQLLKRFGDIPQVHTHMKYIRMRQQNIRLALDERIENLEAGLHLFPNGSTRRTLTYHVWMRDRGLTPQTVPDMMSEADIEYLRGKGISIEKEPLGNGGYHLKISTE